MFRCKNLVKAAFAKSCESTMQLHHLRINLLLWQIFGFWPPNSQTWYNYYLAYQILMHGAMCHIYVILMALKATIFATGDLQQMVDCWYILLTVLTMEAKIISTYLYGSHVHDLIELLKCDTFQARDEESNKMIRNSAELASRIRLILCTCTLSAASLCASIPLLDGTYKIRKLPLEAWFWFDTESYPNYEFLYAYQSIGLVIQATMLALIESFIIGTMVIANGQLDLLAYKLKNIGIDQGADGFDKELVKCVKHHKDIRKFVKRLEDMYGVSYFFQFLMGGSLLCLTGYQLTHVSTKDQRAQFLMTCIYLIMILCQLFLPCWFGNEIMRKSTSLGAAFHESQWTQRLFMKSSIDGKKNNQLVKMRDSRIFIEGSKRSIKFQAGGLFVLGMPAFTSILNSAYSFYALLQNMQRK